jgi:thiamine transporter ThiT
MILQFYLCAFFAGLFLANAVQHFVHGISGNKFPSPFAKPPGKGLSSATVNVIWGLFNAIVGTILFIHSAIKAETTWLWATFFVGVALISIPMSIRFSKKDKE